VKLGIVVGLESEARIAAPLGAVEIGGGTASGAEEAVMRLLRQDVEALLSFGFAGGLSPVLRPGHLVVPDSVLVDGVYLQTDASLAARFARRRGVMLGAHAVIGSVAARRATHAATGAAAVDLESGAVAAAAHVAALPFAVVRAVCDAWDRELPRVVAAALEGNGRVASGRIARGLLRYPGDVFPLIGLARDAARARRTLRHAVANAVASDNPRTTRAR
jgi:adenosylhomocysteine nucleosidase